MGLSFKGIFKAVVIAAIMRFHSGWCWYLGITWQCSHVYHSVLDVPLA